MKIFNRKQIIQFVLSLVLGIVILLILFQFVDLQNVLLNMRKLSPWELIATIPLGLGVAVIASFRWYAILRAMQNRPAISFWQTLLIYSAGYPAGYVFPSYGATSQVSRALVCEHYKLPRKLHVSSLSLELAIHGGVHLVSIIIALFVLILVGFSSVQKYLWLLILAFIIAFFVCGYLWIHTPKKLAVYKKEIARAFHKSPKWISAAVGTVFLGYVWAFIEVFCFAHFIDVDLSFYGVSLYAIIAVIFLGLPSPLTLGTNEATGATTFSLLGLSPEIGIAVSLVYRLAYLMPPLFGAGILFFILFMVNGHRQKRRS